MNESKYVNCRCQALTIFCLIFILLSPLYAQPGKMEAGYYWVFLGPKNTSKPIELPSQTLERRLARAGVANPTEYDLPVDGAMVEEIRSSGAEIREVSRWLNAVSVEAGEEALSRIGSLPFVVSVSRVSSYRMPLPSLMAPGGGVMPKPALLDYGPSQKQISMLAIDSLHNLGFSGNNILIGMMDTGFDTTHEAFTLMDRSRRVVATRNYIDGGSDVMGPVDAQRFHGTATLSVLGGFHQGDLIGSAYGAKFILARTEIIDSEVVAEEDHWIAASEWMESLGVDIISSSLGYIDWYDTTQLDGQTAAITRAANVANSLGVIVVNCAGNEGNSFWHKVTPPADGDSVIAAGAVDSLSRVPAFSSRGPTADGRIKPDFAAMGVADYAAIYSGGYGRLSGTSFSAPLLAGGIALLLEAHPRWNLSKIITNLKMASSMANQPDNNIGWGIPNFVTAIYTEPFTLPGQGIRLFIAPHPAHDSVYFHITGLATGLSAILSVHEISGEEIVEWGIMGQDAPIIQPWDGRNRSGRQIASGIYICVLKTGDKDIREKLAYFSR